MILRMGSFRFEFPRPALIMGILNVTPDSFSDGGQFYDRQRAIDRGLELVAEGAEIIDIGGESTRPRAVSVSESEELRRTIPVIEALAAQRRTILSIDTQKPSVARAAIAAGACLVNDIAANRSECAMWELVAQHGVGYVLMHMQGTPQEMQTNPIYENVVSDVDSFFRERNRRVQSCGVNPEQIILDPGIGFGKTVEHNLELLASLGRFRMHERPMLLGASRKSFIGKLLGAELNERLPGSLACALWAVLNGVQIIRTHDVRATVQAVRMVEEIGKRCQP
jgi:dihydropteroate synthase